MSRQKKDFSTMVVYNNSYPCYVLIRKDKKVGVYRFFKGLSIIDIQKLNDAEHIAHYYTKKEALENIKALIEKEKYKELLEPLKLNFYKTNKHMEYIYDEVMECYIQQEPESVELLIYPITQIKEA